MSTDNIKKHIKQDHTFHISKAKRNERFYNKINFSDSFFNEWGIVTLFYSSVHYVDAVLSQDSSLPDNLRDPMDHHNRNSAISKCTALLPIASKYLQLSEYSRDARYNQTFFEEGILNNIKTNLFDPIQIHIRNYLGISLESDS